MCAERTDGKATGKQKNGRGSVQADRVRVMLVVNLASHSPCRYQLMVGHGAPKPQERVGRQSVRAHDVYRLRPQPWVDLTRPWKGAKKDELPHP
jgi:hypothetical protein